MIRHPGLFLRRDLCPSVICIDYLYIQTETEKQEGNQIVIKRFARLWFGSDSGAFIRKFMDRLKAVFSSKAEMMQAASFSDEFDERGFRPRGFD